MTLARTIGMSDEDLVSLIRSTDTSKRNELRQQYGLAVDYLEGRQESDIQSELTHRFPASQEGDAGQQIFPITMPLTERYIAEAANAYNRAVTRSLVDEEGEESDATREATSIMNRCLAEAKYDELMHRAEQLTVLLGTSCIWYQAKRGNIRPVITLPQDLWPTEPQEADFVDLSDPDDYAGYCIELHGATKETSSGATMSGGKRNHFAFMSLDEVVFYDGKEPAKPENILNRVPNPYMWEQHLDVVGDDGSRTTNKANAPGRMMTFWHRRLPIGEVITKTDVDIVNANREINIVWSVLFDLMRFQGHAVPVLKLTNPGQTKARRKWGGRFPMNLNLEEAFEFHNANIAYTEQVTVLKDYAKAFAMAKRMSPNDFSTDAAAAISGFAKLVDSLPKLEAREERLRRLKHMEEQVASRRILAVLVQQGKLPSTVMGLRMRVDFADVEFPRTPDEKAKEIETKLKNNLTTQAKLLAQMEGITLEEAEEMVAEHAAANASSRQQAPQQPGGGIGGGSLVGLFGNRIRQTTKAKKDDDDGDNDGQATRRNRREGSASREGDENSR